MQTWVFLLTSVEFNMLFLRIWYEILITREAILVTLIKFN